jgi:type II secretory pathway pseudopilin PulG
LKETPPNDGGVSNTHHPLMQCSRRGGSLIEILIGLVIVLIAVIGSLNQFAIGMGAVGKAGNRRAALERTRERLEQLLAANISLVQPPDGAQYWLTCTGTPCTWTRSAAPVTQAVSVNDLPAQPIETTIQWVHDPASGTPATVRDTLLLGVKVWFTRNTGTDNEMNRVYIRTLRTP